MAYTHKIEIQEERHIANTVSSKRVSQTRKYLACLVATVTEETIRLSAERLKKVSAEYEEWTRILNERVQKLGMTPAEARAKHKAESDAWFDSKNPNSFFNTSDRIRKEQGLSHDPKAVKALMLKQGFVDPYTEEGPYGIERAENEALSRARTLSGWVSPKLGAQGVISWHGTVALAQKALSTSSVEWYRERGDKVEIRTDITITESTKK